MCGTDLRRSPPWSTDTVQCTENRVGVVFGDSGEESQPQLILIPVNPYIWPVFLAAHWSVPKVGVFHQSYLEKIALIFL